MSNSKSYQVPEAAPSLVADPVGVCISPNTDIQTLRHNVMDAVYATNDQSALYNCWVFLSNLTNQSETPIKGKMLKRLEELALLKEGWDGENSVSVDSGIQDFIRRVIMQSSDKELVNWVLFPDARGYLYLDYTEGKNIAGITIAPHQIAAFIKRDGHLSKYNYDHLNEQDVLNLLEEAHGKDNQ